MRVETGSVAKKLQELEQRLRRANGIQAILVGALLLIVLSGQANEPALGVLEGKSLTLRTEDGRVWLRAEPLTTGGQVVLYSAESARGAVGPLPGITVKAEAERKYIAFTKGQQFALLYLGVEGDNPGVLMLRPDMTMCAQMGPATDGVGGFYAMDRSGEVVWTGPPDANLLKEEQTKDGSAEDED